MISVLLGQIIRIFDKENSPPRGSSRDQVSQGELFSWRALCPRAEMSSFLHHVNFRRIDHGHDEGHQCNSRWEIVPFDYQKNNSYDCKKQFQEKFDVTDRHSSPLS